MKSYTSVANLMWKCNIWSSSSFDWIQQSRNKGFLRNLVVLSDYFSPVWYFFSSLSEVTKLWMTEKLLKGKSEQIKTERVGWAPLATLNAHIAVIVSLVFSNVAVWHRMPSKSVVKGINDVVNLCGLLWAFWAFLVLWKIPAGTIRQSENSGYSFASELLEI